MTDLDELLNMCRRLASEVSQFLVEKRPETLRSTTKSSATDVVTEMDSAAEAMVRGMLDRDRPDDGMMGEEGTGRAGDSGVTWIVDPIDGTTNYLYRLPAWAVSIAAVVDGRSVVGCIAAPELQMVVFAVRGRGAWWIRSGIESQLRVSHPTDLGQALIATGFGYLLERRRHQGVVVSGLMPQIRDIRRSGAASVDLCWVAAGLVDGYYEAGLHPWDFAAGALIVEEAGGMVGTLSGESVWPTGPEDGERKTLIASSPVIYDPLRSLLLTLGADRTP